MVIAIDPQYGSVGQGLARDAVRKAVAAGDVDLLMGDALRKTGTRNLFTVFGEPDIAATRTGADDANEVTVTLNGDSFFVRNCYLTGGNDPYKRLKIALKAAIDPGAGLPELDRLRALCVPSTGRIAVKVIHNYGDEVMKVFEVSK